jgi:hypothetical protein
MKPIFSTLLLLCLLSACKKEIDPRFSVTAQGVGPITKTTTTAELEGIFDTDSIVRPAALEDGKPASENIEVFEKGGAPLLSISPTTDSIPRVANVRILDPRYVTPEGVNVLSTFKDLREKLKIKKVVTSLNNVVILIRDSDLYFTISKEELPADLRFVNTDIDVIQIPDKAKIKYMMIGWN